MSCNVSPPEKLFRDSLPRLNKSLDMYYSNVAEKCIGDKSQVLGELKSRIKQCEFLLNNIYHIEQQQLNLALHAITGSDEHFKASCESLDIARLFTESFYWVSHKVIHLIIAKQSGLRHVKLPCTPNSFQHGGVTDVRNHIIEHPYEVSNTFGMGGMSKGPVLNNGAGKNSKGDKIKDNGLYINAAEWADTVSEILVTAIKKLNKNATEPTV